MSDVLSPLNSHPIEECQICASRNLSPAVFLGYVPPVNAMLPVGSTPDAELRFPLELLRCDDCSLVHARRARLVFLPLGFVRAFD